MLSVRRTNVHPAGGVIVAVDGLTPTDAIITSPEAVPAGREMVSVVLVVAADVAARNAGVESVADVADRN